MDPERERVGRARLDAFITAQGQLHAEAMSLTMSLASAAHAGYSDEALAAIETDCRDLATASHALADLGRRLAKQWRQQRLAEERRGSTG
jgi:hypothetical protein